MIALRRRFCLFFLAAALVVPGSIAAARIPILNWQIPLPDAQLSAWAVWHNKVVPVPRKTDTTSKVRVGGTGGGLDLTVRYFIPFYYGLLYEYMPVYSDTATPSVAGYGTVETSAYLYAHYFAGAIYLPVGDWIWEIFLERIGAKWGKFYQSRLRSPYAKTSYGTNYMYASIAAGGESSTTSAWRIGYTLEAGLMFIVVENLRAYLAFDYHSIYEDNYYLTGFKMGLSYRHRFGTNAN